MKRDGLQWVTQDTLNISKSDLKKKRSPEDVPSTHRRSPEDVLWVWWTKPLPRHSPNNPTQNLSRDLQDILYLVSRKPAIESSFKLPSLRPLARRNARKRLNFISWSGNNVDDPWPMESPGDILRFAQSPNALRMS